MVCWARRDCGWPAGWISRPLPPRPPPARAKAVIQIWLWGGACHLDTFDPKPEAGYDYCGPFKTPIETNVPGIKICELLPLLAKQADKYSLIRSMTHGNNAHETASYMVQTGLPLADATSFHALAPWCRCSRVMTPDIGGSFRLISC